MHSLLKKILDPPLLPNNKEKKIKQLTNCARLSDSREVAKIVKN